MLAVLAAAGERRRLRSPGQNGKIVFETMRATDLDSQPRRLTTRTTLTLGIDHGPRTPLVSGREEDRVRHALETAPPFPRDIGVMNADGSDPVKILDCSSLPVTDCVIGEPCLVARRLEDRLGIR